MVVIFKPTVRCNIICKHCYVGSVRYAYSDISVDKAHVIFEKLPRGAEIVFHGGEPLLLGVNFYTEITREFIDKFKFSMQTNLTLLDDSWIDFFRDVLCNRVSTSFDFMASLRPIDTNGWFERVKLLKKNHITPYVVSLYWKGNQNMRAVDILSFFNDLSLSFRLNYVENIGYAVDNGFSSLRHDPFCYARTIKDIFDLWFMNPRVNILIDPCAEILSFFLAGSSVKKCPFSSKCYANIMSINPNGDVFPCGGFDYFGGFKYGNLVNERYSDVLQSRHYVDAGCRVLNLPEKCQICEFFHICEGGCRLEAYSFYGDINRETSMCEEYKDIFTHIQRRIESEKGDINDWWMSLLAKRNGNIS